MAKTLNKISFCDFCENYIETVDAYTTLHTDNTEGVSCEDCLDEMTLIGEVVMSWRTIG